MMDANREAKYEDILKRPSRYAERVGSRKPVYVNYTKDGRLKDKPAAVMEEQKDGKEV